MVSETTILVARENDRDALGRALRRGEVERLRYGAYRVVDAGATGPEYRSDVVARALAVHRQLATPHVFSHQTAAVLWGLRTWTAPERTHVVQGYRASARSAADIARHLVPLDPADVAEAHGVPVTALARTVVDCGLTLQPLEALVIADSALARGLDRDETLAALGRRGSTPGRRRAQLVLELADAGADSAWETWLRYVALRAGLPRATTQHRVATRLGTFRVDLAWPEHGVLAEFDGQVKYRDGAFGTRYDADAVRFDEKRRADAIEEATGRSLLRVTARDRPEEVAARLLRRFPAAVAAAAGVDPRLPAPTRVGGR